MIQTTSPRRIAVVGAGGVGGLIAGMLARGGHDVGLLTRGAALAAIRDHGVRLRGLDGDHTIPLARVADTAAALGPADFVIVTVKTWQLAALGPTLAPLIGPATLVIPTQNGVEASELLRRALGADHVIGGVAHMISWIESPGVIRWIGMHPTLRIGALTPSQRDPVQAAADPLRAGGLDVTVVPNIEQVRWAKLLFISAYAAVGAVERAPLGAWRHSPTARARLEAVMRETFALAAARGIALPDATVTDALGRVDGLPDDATASMHRDLIEGRPSELHELLGAVVRLGRDAGVPTPVSAELYAQLEPLEAAARAAHPAR